MSTAELLREAARSLDQQTDPFGNAFLTKNEVTFDQVMTLAEQLALGARIVAQAIEDPKSPQGVAMLLTLVEGK